MNKPVVEPIRDHFGKRLSVEDVPLTEDEVQQRLEFQLYPMSFHRFGSETFGTWGPRDLSDEQLETTLAETKERLELYVAKADQKQKAEERKQLDALLQEIQRRRARSTVRIKGTGEGMARATNDGSTV